MAGAEDGLASVISTELNLGRLLPDPAQTDTITSCHRPCGGCSEKCKVHRNAILIFRTGIGKIVWVKGFTTSRCAVSLVRASGPLTALHK